MDQEFEQRDERSRLDREEQVRAYERAFQHRVAIRLELRSPPFVVFEANLQPDERPGLFGATLAGLGSRGGRVAVTLRLATMTGWAG